MAKAFLAAVAGISVFAAAAERHYYGAVLEPPAGVISGAGQVDAESFLNYCSVMTDSTLPLINMQYKGLDKPASSIIESQKPRLERIEETYPWIRLIPQYGISMTKDGSPHKHYEHLVAAGEYDDSLRLICESLKQLDRPLYLRIGYECNGEWNGYEPDTYRAAFRHVADMVREFDLPAALVWNVYPPETAMEYYPGDDYVDWWSFDLFDASDGESSGLAAFLDSAHAHGKPVMIGESTPRRVGVDDGEADWNAWFKPFFELIASQPGIKAFGYINWHWGETQWSNWGDARIHSNEFVADAFAHMMHDSLYRHAPNRSSQPSVTLWKTASFTESGDRQDALLFMRGGSADTEVAIHFTLRPAEGPDAATADSITIPAGKHTVMLRAPAISAAARAGAPVSATARLLPRNQYTIAYPDNAVLDAISTGMPVDTQPRHHKKKLAPQGGASEDEANGVRQVNGRLLTTEKRAHQNSSSDLPAGAYIIEHTRTRDVKVRQ